MKMVYLEALHQKLNAEATFAEQDLENLLTNAVGIGDHAHISADVEELVKKIDNLRSQAITTKDLMNKFGG